VSRLLVIVIYVSILTCGAIVLLGLGASAPAMTQQGGALLTALWGSLCVIAGCVGLVNLWLRARQWEILAALIGASATLTWTASLILQAIDVRSLNTVSAACMGTTLTALLAHRAWRAALDESP
jgi:hypothetical protein